MLEGQWEVTRRHSSEAITKLRTCHPYSPLRTCIQVRQAWLQLLFRAREARSQIGHRCFCHPHHFLELRELQHGHRSITAGNPRVSTAVLTSRNSTSSAKGWPPPSPAPAKCHVNTSRWRHLSEPRNWLKREAVKCCRSNLHEDKWKLCKLV